MLINVVHKIPDSDTDIREKYFRYVLENSYMTKMNNRKYTEITLNKKY